MSEKQYRDKIVAIRKQQASDETNRGKARAAAGKHRADAAKELQKITPRTSASMARTYQRNAENLEKRAQAEDKKVSALSVKLSKSAGDLATAEENLAREIKSSAKKEEDKKKADARTREQADARRQQKEKSHAREIARLSSPTVHYVTVQPPKPEILRVLYLTANPEMDLRTEVEVRDVQQAVKRALHRDLIDIQYRPAATPEDLLDGLNDVRPHVVHFSGHAGDAAVLFDNASVDGPEGRDVPFELLARALSATAEPPKLLTLNGCDTLDGAEVLLEATPVIIAMATQISDLAASAFAARFYAAIASAQPIGPALRQGAVVLDLMGLDEGWKPTLLSRDDLDVDDLVLVRVAGE
ncbi:CHAT domain-containing protein [uncultured Serinicoccus sp.]|uniref:CHAT domain-containing protein n=1 Tax=uncultured Serinicoccus sp. TaxID=735514 RepID=UPI002603B190|nr:CHAT domain-containing protein [uncultured Serinicoccus sp.]